MGAPESTSTEPRRRRSRRGAVLVAALVVAGALAFALTRIDLSRIGHSLITASPGWLALALALMGSSLVLRSISWQQTLLAALPGTDVALAAVARATMIGVMASAVFPGRIGEPSRVIVLARRLEGPNRSLLAVLAGTVFSQTLINLLAIAILAAVTLTGAPLLNGHLTGVAAALILPLAACALVLAGPRLLRLSRRSGSPRLASAADTVERMLRLARQGLIVFARPRFGARAIAAQLLAWVLQWLACWCVLLALGLQSHAGLLAAAAILLAINVSAVLPATPSNVGVFQAACLVVLAAYGVGAGPGLAYGIILQAVEVVTALGLGVPALLGEGLTWQEMRRGARSAGDGAE